MMTACSARQACLEHAEVIVGEPKGPTLELLATAPKLRWFQATFAGCNGMVRKRAHPRWHGVALGPLTTARGPLTRLG